MKLIIIGGGFGGVWSAMAAARHRKLLEKDNDIEIMLINRDAYHGIRPRFYESDLSQTQVPLDKILTPLNIKLCIGEVADIDHPDKKIKLNNGEIHSYDSLILAAGSQLYSPPLPGLNECSFNTDTFAAAKKLDAHLQSLPDKLGKGQYTVVVVGGSFTGLEVATEMVERLKNIAQDNSRKKARIIIVDHNKVGSALGANMEPYITTALQERAIETRSGTSIKSISKDHIILQSDETIDTQTVIWAAGMRANPLTALLSVTTDKLGRLPVDSYLQISNTKDCFAAGDVAAAMTDDSHISLMSCQHAMPQGRIAGYNAIANLCGVPLIAYRQERYVTCLDMGTEAIYAEGWNREVKKVKMEAKKIKQYINCERIYPPLTGNPDDLYQAAAPGIKPIPEKVSQ